MSHVTLEEIVSQPEVWSEVADLALSQRKSLQKYLGADDLRETVFIGCGTSYYLALSAASFYTLVTGRKTSATAASEVLSFPETMFPDTRDRYNAVLISRSGETTEIVRAAELTKKRLEDEVYGVSCRPESPLIRICPYSLVVPSVADEQSVVMTRSFTSMLLLLQYLAVINADNPVIEGELESLPKRAVGIIDRNRDLIKSIGQERDLRRFIYLGQGPYYGLACEAMLKIKEMSLSTSEAYHSMEFRHGPMSMVDDTMLITFLVSERNRTEEIALLKEMKTLGAHILVICEEADSTLHQTSDYVVELRSGVSDLARMVLYMPIVQLLGYYKAVDKGLDPDNPKNLSQVVTLQ